MTLADQRTGILGAANDSCATLGPSVHQSFSNVVGQKCEIRFRIPPLAESPFCDTGLAQLEAHGYRLLQISEVSLSYIVDTRQ